MTRLLAALSMIALGAGAAHAHGTIPTSNSISFGPGGGGVLLGTNFGGVLRLQGGDDRFLCERLVTGEQTSVDVWLWLASGGVAGVVTTGGFIQGVYVSDGDACGFTIVPGSERLFMTDLTADPERDTGFYAVGATSGDSSEARLLRRTQAGVDVIASVPGAATTKVRAAGGHAYTIFLTGDAASFVHHGPDGNETFVHTREDDAVWKVIGVDPVTPTTLWFVVSSAQNDVLYRSSDAGETMTPVLTVAARIGGFAIDGANVWVQSSQLGVYASSDGGQSFAPIPKSPHGTCLARSSDGKLYACGVPWQDGMALGVSSDGSTFAAVVPYYDGIVGALDCAANPAGTTLCNEELDFLREYYGFSGPSPSETSPEVVEPVVEPGPEQGPEPVAEASADGVEAVEVAESAPKDDGGCGGGAVDGGVLALGVALMGWRRRVSERT